METAGQSSDWIRPARHVVESHGWSRRRATGRASEHGRSCWARSRQSSVSSWPRDALQEGVSAEPVGRACAIARHSRAGCGFSSRKIVGLPMHPAQLVVLHASLRGNLRAQRVQRNL